MSNLHHGATPSAKNFAFINAATADARSWKHAEHAACSTASAEAKLAIHAGIDIVKNQRGTAEAGLQELLNRYVAPAKVRCIEHDSAIEVERARTTDADAGQSPRAHARFFERPSIV